MLKMTCPYCGYQMKFNRDKRIRVLKEAMCQFCGGDITHELKRTYLKDLALGISIDIMRKENQDFFEQLENKWKERFNSDSL